MIVGGPVVDIYSWFDRRRGVYVGEESYYNYFGLCVLCVVWDVLCYEIWEGCFVRVWLG